MLTGLGIAQAPKSTGTNVKPAKLKSFLGIYTGRENNVPAREILTLLALPLKVQDEKKIEYKIISYNINYTRKVVSEDEASGKQFPTQETVGRRFDSTPLPKLWQTNVSENLHKGEEILFYDIIVEDAKGAKQFAPDLKITIQ